jgi:tellurite resistance protein
MSSEGWLTRIARRLGALVDGGGSAANARAAAPSVPQAARDPGEVVEGHPNIRINAAGRFVTDGLSFSTLAQAAEHDRRRADEFARIETLRAKTRTTTHAPSATKREAPRWIAAREELSAGGAAFHADMVYFGTPLRADPRHDHSRIDPTLRVDPRGDAGGHTLDYWPSYARLDPRARATYLQWLSGGRSDRNIPIGYVFLFFYGLEQRLLVDDARGEASLIFDEVRRLLALHGDNYSFRSYASRLLALSALYEDLPDGPATPDCAATYDVELPLDLRVRIGRRVRDQQPLSADDALRWVLALPDVHLRTPGQRCFEELRALFVQRFQARHPDGLTIRKPRKSLSHEYRAASGTFSMTLSVEELPDVAGTSAPLGVLRTILDACMEDLSTYSRLIGREPGARGLLRADLLLPVELQSTRPSVASCRETLLSLHNGGRAVLGAGELARMLDVELPPSAEKLPLGTTRQIGAALDALSHGWEPDRRYGSTATLRLDTPVCVFPSGSEAVVDHERPAYAQARTMVEIGALAAGSDGSVVEAELTAIHRRLLGMPDLEPHEVSRLMAYAEALAADPPKMRSALKRLSEVPMAERSAIAAIAVETALADGQVRPDEIRFLEALHAALELPASDLYSAIHRSSGEDEGPVLVIQGKSDAEIPLPREEAGIDVGRLERIRAETTRVSALLATIFVEDEPAAQPAPPRERVDARSAFSGLSGTHSQLLLRILERDMTRDEFESAAAELRLMPDGAFEAINDWAFDAFDEPLLDDGDVISIAPHLRQKLTLTGEAA